MKRIILLIIVVVSSVFVFSQQKPKVPFLDPAYRGFSVHADIASPVMGIVVGKDVVNVELLADVNLYDRFFPVFELGYTSVKESVGESTYSAQSPFFKLGMNFNIIRTATNKGIYKENKSYAYLGVRYAFSMFGYELNNVKVTNDYWGTDYVVNYSNPLVYCGWAELHAGVRVDMVEGFTMGWSVGIKLLAHSTEEVSKKHWYVPGFGKMNPLNFSFKYTLGYTFKTKKAKELVGTKVF